MSLNTLAAAFAISFAIWGEVVYLAIKWSH